jgi:hypothetical protein
MQELPPEAGRLALVEVPPTTDLCRSIVEHRLMFDVAWRVRRNNTATGATVQRPETTTNLLFVITQPHPGTWMPRCRAGSLVPEQFGAAKFSPEPR